MKGQKVKKGQKAIFPLLTNLKGRYTAFNQLNAPPLQLCIKLYSRQVSIVHSLLRTYIQTLWSSCFFYEPTCDSDPTFRLSNLLASIISSFLLPLSLFLSLFPLCQYLGLPFRNHAMF